MESTNEHKIIWGSRFQISEKSSDQYFSIPLLQQHQLHCTLPLLQQVQVPTGQPSGKALATVVINGIVSQLKLNAIWKLLSV